MDTKNLDEWEQELYRENIRLSSNSGQENDPMRGTKCSDNRGGLVVPKVATSRTVLKPIRRRSCSKKAPTTLLTANPRNFQALVQQFTGCHSHTTTSYKGPINLSFAPKEDDRQQYDQAQDQSLFSFGGATTTTDSLSIRPGNNQHDQFLTTDDIDMVHFSLQESHFDQLEPGTSTNDDFGWY